MGLTRKELNVAWDGREDVTEESTQSVGGYLVDSFQQFLPVCLSRKARLAQPGVREASISPDEPGSRHFRSISSTSTYGRMQIENITLVMTA